MLEIRFLGHPSEQAGNAGLFQVGDVLLLCGSNLSKFFQIIDWFTSVRNAQLKPIFNSPEIIEPYIWELFLRTT